MISTAGRLKAREYLDALAAAGRYHFALSDAQTEMGVSTAALKVALGRQAQQHLIASPARGFYVVVPPEYRSLRCLPADQFIPALMQSRRLPYYAGLLTAAQYYGAAHQRPQAFQVFLEKPRRPIVCGKVRVVFLVRKHAGEVPARSFNTPRGSVLVSTPEATALDLVGYQHQAGGLNHVANVLAELAEQIDTATLATTAASAPVAWAQRLGYLLERVGATEKASALKAHVRAHAREATALVPRAPRRKAAHVQDWKLYANAELELDQ
jgi:predicted transcriptional regulator of viral defense system